MKLKLKDIKVHPKLATDEWLQIHAEIEYAEHLKNDYIKQTFFHEKWNEIGNG